MKVHIIGAGPAGSIAALSAVRNNSSAVVSEEHSCSGIPTNCSGLVSKSGLDSLKDYVDYKKFIENEFNGAIIDFSGIQFSVEKKDSIAYSINRSSFDQELISNAEKEGAKIDYNDKVNENFYSNILIGADGPNSTIAKKFNFPKIKKFVCTAQKEVKHSCEDPRKVYLYYSNKLFPGFFGWIIPKNKDYVEVGCGSVLPNNPKKGFSYLLTKLNADPEDVSFSIIPISVREKTSLSQGNKKVLLVGDAAGQTKATTGGGIVFGGNCASIAGKLADDPEKYESEWNRNFGFDLSTHSLIQSFLEQRGEKGLRNIGKFLNTVKIDGYLSTNGDMDSPSKMVNLNLLAHFVKNIF